MALHADEGRPSCSAPWFSDDAGSGCAPVFAGWYAVLSGTRHPWGPRTRLGGVILEELEAYVATVHCVWVSCVAYDDHGRLQGSRTPATSGQHSTGTKS